MKFNLSASENVVLDTFTVQDNWFLPDRKYRKVDFSFVIASFLSLEVYNQRLTNIYGYFDPSLIQHTEVEIPNYSRGKILVDYNSEVDTSIVGEIQIYFDDAKSIFKVKDAAGISERNAIEFAKNCVLCTNSEGIFSSLYVLQYPMAVIEELDRLFGNRK